MRVYHPTKREEATARWHSNAAAWKVLTPLAVIGMLVLAGCLWPLYDCAGRPVLTTTGTVIEMSFICANKRNTATLYRVNVNTPVGNIQAIETDQMLNSLPVLSAGQRVNVFYCVGRSGHVYLNHINPVVPAAARGETQ